MDTISTDEAYEYVMENCLQEIVSDVLERLSSINAGERCKLCEALLKDAIAPVEVKIRAFEKVRICNKCFALIQKM